jgi:uncharacterized repeat protein (TIGR03943 family)
MDTDRPTAEKTDTRTPRQRAAAWAEIVTIFLLAAFFAYSFFTGRVRYFVASYYIWLSLGAAVALTLMGVVRVMAHFRGYVSGELEEASAWSVPLSACVAVLIIPVVLALVVDPTRYSSEGVRKRMVRATGLDPQFQQALTWIQGQGPAGARGGSAATSLPENPSILDVLTVLQNGDRKAVEGKFVTLVGQADLPDGDKSKRFQIYRLVVTCCIADATAVSVDVARTDQVALESGGWVRVQGIIKFDSKTDASQPVVHVTGEAARIPEPSEPYL